MLGRTDSSWAIFRNMSVVSSSPPPGRMGPEGGVRPMPSSGRPSRARSVCSREPMSPASSPLPSRAFCVDAGSITRLRREPDDRKLLMGGTRTGVVTVGEADAGVVGDWVAEKDGGGLYESGGGRRETEECFSSDEVELSDLDRRSSRWPEDQFFVDLSAEA